jgi:hypothetical protein
MQIENPTVLRMLPPDPMEREGGLEEKRVMLSFLKVGKRI